MKAIKKPIPIEVYTFDDIAGEVRPIPTEKWSLPIGDIHITHENDKCYIVPTPNGATYFTPEDYLINNNGDVYPIKIDIFNKTYNVVGNNLTFSEALEALKTGHKVARQGWNGKNMWLAYMPGTIIPEDIVNGRTKKFMPEGDLLVGGYIVMYTAQGVWQPGWLASQADMLANDWIIL